MMSEQDLADVVQIAVEDLTPDNPGRKRFTALTSWKSLLSFSLNTDQVFIPKGAFQSHVFHSCSCVSPNPLDQIIIFISLFF